MEPKIRYNGYTNKWDDVCLNDIVSTAGIKNRENLPLVSFSITNDQGFVPQDDKFENGGTMRDANKSMYYIVSPKTFAYNPARINIGSIGYYDLEKDVIISSLYVVFKTDQEKCDDYYFLQWFKSDKFKRLIEQYQEGGVRLYFFYDKLCKCHIHIPSKEEQHKISSYFRVLDLKLQASTKKVESLKKLKSASLVAMFPQQGETTPKVRFKGFEGEWKTPSIGYVFELRNGYTPSKIVKEFWEGGTIPWFRMEDIRMNGGFLKDALQHITPWAVKGAGLFEKNSIILATTATIGVHAMLIADSLANQQFTNFKVRKSLSDEYIDEFIYYSFFKIDEWSKNNTNSGGLLSVNMPLLVKQSFLTPCKEEQHAIATFFRSLDRKIALETARLEKLKQIKLACLEKMFV